MHLNMLIKRLNFSYVFCLNTADIFYKDSTGSWDQEYLTLGVDNQAIFYGRTALQIYTDCMYLFIYNCLCVYVWLLYTY